MTGERTPSHQPIGYWLKRAHDLLTIRIDDAQRENGLTRLDWQLLNVVRGPESVTRETLVETLRPFAAPDDVATALVGLTERGILESAGDSFALTSAGEALYARALAVQKSIRERAFAGVTEAEYQTTISVLERLVRNLEA